MKKIPFSKPFLSGKEFKYMKDSVINGSTIAGDGTYTKKVHDFFEGRYGVKKALLTTSATTAMELAIRLIELNEGDEVLAPSFTFSSSVNAILLDKGVKVVFIDVEEETLNMDLDDLEAKITPKSKAIMIVHYAGASCDMDRLLKIARKNKLRVIEDAAQGVDAKYKGKYLGTIGDMGALSFHGTKNVTCGEGGILFINRNEKKLIEKAEIIREKGTNRSMFLRGEVDKYTWVSLGSSILPSDILAAFLYAQLEDIDRNTKKRKEIFDYYYKSLQPFEGMGLIKLQAIPEYTTHNGHIFYMLFQNTDIRNEAMDYLKSQGISAVFHYIPLHSSPFGKTLGFKSDDCPVTEKISHNLLRLPIHSNITKKEMKYIVKHTTDFLNTLKSKTQASQAKQDVQEAFANQ
jgi:dTDP-4-amino-4,6-dideoxygalactose transaminase